MASDPSVSSSEPTPENPSSEPTPENFSSEPTAPENPSSEPTAPENSSSEPTAPEKADESPPERNPQQQVQLKSEDGRLLLILPPESQGNDIDKEAKGAATWNEIWQQLKHRLNAGDRFWEANTEVYLIAQDRLLDVRQLHEIAEALSENKLKLVRVAVSRRQTAVAAATAGYSLEQHTSLDAFNKPAKRTAKALADPLYLETTVRSGVEIRHPGTVIVRGDINPGGEVIARGDIIVWGRLRGVVHAGSDGNSQCLIMALEMNPTQIRIADYVARAPDAPPEFYPEVAYVSSLGIRIARAADFSKTLLSDGPN